MMKFKKLLLALALLAFAMPAMANIVANVAVPPTRATGTTITAAIWNNDVNGIYTYLNNTVIPALNKLTTKGDLYVTDGVNLNRLAVGTDGQALAAASAQTNGLQWVNFANAVALTTKGDLLGYAAAAARIPVGANGTVLTADSTNANGVSFQAAASAAPKGSIVAWSPSGAGTSTIPSGWLLCDGTSSTPNLIGRFIIGTRPSGSAAVASVGGYGAQTVDATGAGAATHVHAMSGSVATGLPSATTPSTQAYPPGVYVVSQQSHTHTITYSGDSTSATTEPADYALVYIMKQ